MYKRLSQTVSQHAEEKNVCHLVRQKIFITHIQTIHFSQFLQSTLIICLQKQMSMDKTSHSCWFFSIWCALQSFLTTCLFWMLIYKDHLSVELDIANRNLLVGWVQHWRIAYWTYQERSRLDNVLRIPQRYWPLWKVWVFFSAGLNSLGSGRKLRGWGRSCLQRDGKKSFVLFLCHLTKKNSNCVSANSVHLGVCRIKCLHEALTSTVCGNVLISCGMWFWLLQWCPEAQGNCILIDLQKKCLLSQ